MKEYEFHEAANIFPLDDEHIDELAEDIREQTQKYPIHLCEGKILDGRRRYLACRMAEIVPTTIKVSPPDPIAHVMSLNKHRRHMTPSQLAMVGEKAKGLYAKQAKERQKEAGKTHGKGQPKLPVELPEAKGFDARDAAGKAVGVSGKLIDHAGKVRKKGVPELAKAVEEGRLSVTAAADIADETPEVQKKMAEAATFSGGRYRKPKIDKPESRNRKDLTEAFAVSTVDVAITQLKAIPAKNKFRAREFSRVQKYLTKEVKQCP